MRYLKSKNRFRVIGYLLAAVCIAGFLLLNVFNLKATQPDTPCPEWEPCPYREKERTPEWEPCPYREKEQICPERLPYLP